MNSRLIEELIRAHGAALQLYASQWCRCPQDCVQNALIKLTRSEEVPSAIVPWLYRVVRNEAISAGRSERRRRFREDQYARQRFENSDSEPIDVDQLEQSLERLTPDLREIITAKIWGGLTFDEIAQVVGSSSTTVHRKYAKGLSQLKEKLGLEWLTKK